MLVHSQLMCGFFALLFRRDLLRILFLVINHAHHTHVGSHMFQIYPATAAVPIDFLFFNS